MSQQHAYEQLVAKTREGILGAADNALWQSRIIDLLGKCVSKGEVSLVGPLQRPDVGASSGNILFTARYDAGQGPGEHELVLRYQPSEGLMDSYDMAMQFRVQQALAGAGVKVSTPLCLDADGSVLGSPGYVMQRATGSAPRQYYYSQGPLADADAPTRKALIDDVMQTLTQIHALDWRAAGLAELRGGQAGTKPIGEEILFYSDVLRFVSSEIAESLAGHERWLLEHQPEVSQPVLTHGDYQPSNMLFADGQLSAVLDWETARISAAESDLAWLIGVNAFARLLGGATNVVQLSDEEMLEAYQRASGRTLQHRDYHLAKGAFCIICVLHAFRRRMSTDERKPFDVIVTVLEERMRMLFIAAGAQL